MRGFWILIIRVAQLLQASYYIRKNGMEIKGVLLKVVQHFEKYENNSLKKAKSDVHKKFISRLRTSITFRLTFIIMRPKNADHVII